MTTVYSNEPATTLPRDPVTDPNAFAHQLRKPTNALHALIEAWYSDKRGNISRPKLLFTVCALDVLAVFVAGLYAYGVAGGHQPPLDVCLGQALVLALAVTTLLKKYWSYTIHALRETPRQLQKVISSVVVIFSGSCGLAYVAGVAIPSPNAMVLWALMAILIIGCMRAVTARIVRSLTRQGRLVRRTVIVGGGPDGEALIAALERDDVKELQILGVFDDRFDDRSGDSIAGYPKLGNFEQLADFCRNAGVELLIVTVPITAEHRLLQILPRLFTLLVDVRISALSSKLRLSSAAYSYIGRVPMLALMDKPLTDWDRVLKNIEDRVIGALLLLMAAPVMALVAIAVKMDSKGPIIFRQRRYGFNNELIEVLKFRSLHVEMQDATASKLVTKGDPRITRVGRFIRKSSLDELPQLINVIRGEMSLVGPRPHATHAKADTDLYQAVVDGYFARHRMKPGVTGWAQINGWRGETDTHEKIQRRVEADMHYIDNWSVLLDLYIIAMTPIALLTGKNAH